MTDFPPTPPLEVPAAVAKVLKDKRLIEFLACWGALLALLTLYALLFFDIKMSSLTLKLAPLLVALLRTRKVLAWNPAHPWALTVRKTVRANLAVMFGCELVILALFLLAPNMETILVWALVLSTLGAHTWVSFWSAKKFRQLASQD